MIQSHAQTLSAVMLANWVEEFFLVLLHNFYKLRKFEFILNHSDNDNFFKTFMN